MHKLVVVAVVRGEQIVLKWQNLSTFECNQKLLVANCNNHFDNIANTISNLVFIRPGEITRGKKGREFEIFEEFQWMHISFPAFHPPKEERCWIALGNWIAHQYSLLWYFLALHFTDLKFWENFTFQSRFYARMNRLFPTFIIAVTAVVKCKKAI